MDGSGEVLNSCSQSKEALAELAILELGTGEFFDQLKVAREVAKVCLSDHVGHYREHLVGIENQLVVVNVNTRPELIDTDWDKITYFSNHLDFLVGVFKVSHGLEFLDRFLIRLYL